MRIGNINIYGIIYGIENKLNGKWYIGQTKTYNGFNSRYNRSGEGIERVYKYHKDFKGTSHCNNHLLCSIEKYGFEVFQIHEIIDYAFSKEELDIKEKCWILIKDSFKNGYNRCEGGDSQLYTCKYSDDTIKILKGMLADVNNSLEYISNKLDIPITYIYKIMKIEAREEICSELNDKILQIRNEDYPRIFIKENEQKITEMYNYGYTKEEIYNCFPNATTRRIINAINKLLKLIPYRNKNRTRICPICGEEFIIKKSSSNSKKYCSKKCSKEGRKIKDKERHKRNRSNTISRKERVALREQYLKSIKKEVIRLYVEDNIKFTNIYKLFQKNGITPSDIKKILIDNNVWRGKYK